MRIGIDARLVEWPGVGRYINELVKNLVQITNNHEFVIYYNSDLSITRYGIQSPNVTNIVFPAPVFSIKEQIYWPFQIKKDRLSVFHSPHYAIPLICSSPRIVTIHDVIGFRYPQHLFSLMAKTYYQWMTRFALKYSAAIIASSKFTKREIIDIFSIKEEKVQVVYLGVNEASFREQKDGIFRLEKEILPKDYFLYLGTKKPWKNLDLLLNGYKQFLDAGYSTKLILAGKDAKHQQDISSKIETLQLNDFVKDVGEVDEQDLPALYQNAAAFIFPSYYEGFGLPILEAMSLGTPVVASNAASIPEVVGAAGILIDPNCADELKDAMVAIVCQEELRNKLKELGSENVKRFDWLTCAKEMMKVYEQHIKP